MIKIKIKISATDGSIIGKRYCAKHHFSTGTYWIYTSQDGYNVHQDLYLKGNLLISDFESYLSKEMEFIKKGEYVLYKGPIHDKYPA